VPEPRLDGKVIVITGATSGIGQVAAEALAAIGGRIVQIARDRARGEAAMARLRAIAPDVRHAIHYADLSRLSEMKRVGREIAQAEARIDVLINNAGAMFGFRQLTEDGFEHTFALNHLSYFVLTEALRERLLASAPARVINTSSGAHRAGTLELDDLQSERAYRSGRWEWMRFGGAGYRVYARSKLCNILFTRELARRLAGTGVTANSFHPGFVATRFGDQSGGLISLGVRIGKRFALSPEEGAETLIYLASSPDVEGVTGMYFVKRRPATPTPAAQDDELAHQLWKETAKITAEGSWSQESEV
jgi:NAD(P)-dependent dehydrogenase (short-subunit alcohol dehydrogenase family)